MTINEQAAKLNELRDQILELADRDGDLADDDAERYEKLNAEFDELRQEHEDEFVRACEYAEEQQRLDVLRSFNAGAFENGDGTRSTPAFHRDVDPYDERYQRDVGYYEAAKRSIGENKRMDGDGQGEAMRKVALSKTDPMHMRGMDEYMLVHSSDAYTRGWSKLIAGRQWEIEPDERHALHKAMEYQQRYDPERGITLTTANGGALIPAHLDPTVILVNAGAANPYRAISNVVPINVNVWNGVTSAGINFATSTEGGDSTDIAPTFGQKAITVAKAHGTIPVTVEALADIDNLGSLLPPLIADAKDRFEATKFTKGSGTNEPKGVVTTVYAETSRRSTHATNSAMTVTDVVDAQNTLDPRFQPNASWIGSLAYLNRVRLLGSSSYSTWSDKLNERLSYNIFGQPAYQVSDMSTALSSITNTAFVYGDFGYYNIIDRVGVSLVNAGYLQSAGNALFDGRVGLYAYFRVGADVTSVTAFIVSTNPGA